MTWLNNEKIAVFAPIPRASDTIATMVTNGGLEERSQGKLDVAHD